MIDERKKKQSADSQRIEKATIYISGIPGDEDDELLCTIYHMIKAECERGRSIQKGNFQKTKRNHQSNGDRGL